MGGVSPLGLTASVVLLYFGENQEGCIYNIHAASEFWTGENCLKCACVCMCACGAHVCVCVCMCMCVFF